MPDVPIKSATAPRGRPLNVGVQLPEVEYTATWSQLRDMARTAEAVGLDSLWVGDHYLYRDARGSRGPWEAWTQLAALAAVTERIALGPLVASTSFHAPTVLAKFAATIEEISGGRLILGLGAGWNETEYRAYGFAFDQRVARFEEAFTIIRTLLRDGEIDFQGQFYTVRDCELLPRGPRPGGPPLMVGSIGPRMLRATLPHVDAWNAWCDWFGNDPGAIGPLRDQVDAACREVGRDPATIERTVALHMAPGDEPLRTDSSGRRTTPLRGSPAELAEALRACARQGIGHVQLVLEVIDARSIERLGSVLQELDSSPHDPVMSTIPATTAAAAINAPNPPA